MELATSQGTILRTVVFLVVLELTNLKVDLKVVQNLKHLGKINPMLHRGGDFVPGCVVYLLWLSGGSFKFAAIF